MRRSFNQVLIDVLHLTWRQARRLVAIVVGATLVSIGIILLFAPGPGTVTIYAGIAILATELVWARSLLRTINIRAKEIGDVINNQAKSVWPRPESSRQPELHSTTRPVTDRGEASSGVSGPNWRDRQPGTSAAVSRPNFLDQNLSDQMIGEGCPNY